jgi:hypothetical protein
MPPKKLPPPSKTYVLVNRGTKPLTDKQANTLYAQINALQVPDKEKSIQELQVIDYIDKQARRKKKSTAKTI